MRANEETCFESDGGPLDEAYAGRLIDDERNDRVGQEINARAKLRAADIDPDAQCATCHGCRAVPWGAEGACKCIAELF